MPAAHLRATDNRDSTIVVEESATVPVDSNGMYMHSGIHVAYWDADNDRTVLGGLSIVAELATILQDYQVKCRDK